MKEVAHLWLTVTKWKVVESFYLVEIFLLAYVNRWKVKVTRHTKLICELAGGPMSCWWSWGCDGLRDDATAAVCQWVADVACRKRSISSSSTWRGSYTTSTCFTVSSTPTPSFRTACLKSSLISGLVSFSSIFSTHSIAMLEGLYFTLVVFFSMPNLWGHWTNLNQAWTHNHLWLLFEKFGPNYPGHLPPRSGGAKNVFWDRLWTLTKHLCNGIWYQQSERNLSIYLDSSTCPQIWWTLVQKQVRTVG